MACCPCGVTCLCNSIFAPCPNTVTSLTSTFSGFGTAGGQDFSPVNGSQTICIGGTNLGAVTVTISGNEPVNDTIQVVFSRGGQSITYSTQRSNWGCCTGSTTLNLLSGPVGGTYPNSITLTATGICDCALCPEGMPTTLHVTLTIDGTGQFGCGCCSDSSLLNVVTCNFGAGPNTDGIPRLFTYSWMGVLPMDICIPGLRLMLEYSNNPGNLGAPVGYTFYNINNPGTTSTFTVGNSQVCGPFQAVSNSANLGDEFGSALCAGNCALFISTWTL